MGRERARVTKASKSVSIEESGGVQIASLGATLVTGKKSIVSCFDSGRFLSSPVLDVGLRVEEFDDRWDRFCVLRSIQWCSQLLSCWDL